MNLFINILEATLVVGAVFFYLYIGVCIGRGYGGLWKFVKAVWEGRGTLGKDNKS